MNRAIKKSVKIQLIVVLFLIFISLVINAEDKLVTLTVRQADIKDVLVMLTEQSGINMVPDNTVKGKVTLNLNNVNLEDAINILTVAYGYKFEKIKENTFLVSKNSFSKSMVVKVVDKLLTLHVVDRDIKTILNKIGEEAGINIIMEDSVRGKFSIDLDKVPLKQGLRNFLEVNGFSITEDNGVYRVFKLDGRNKKNNMAISVFDGKVSINVEQADMAEVLRTIAKLAKINMVLFDGVRQRVDLKLDEIPIGEAIELILSGTRCTYRKINGIYLIGDKNINSPAASLLTTTELIPLQYLEAEQVPKLLTNNFSGSNIKVLKEQNAVMATGTERDLLKLKDYMAKIDKKIPQIVVEALIIDISHTAGKSPRAELGINYEDKDGTTLLDSVNGLLNYKSILTLPEDFNLTLQSLVKQGQVTVKAKPNITTLNGQEAKINVETVQYYEVVRRDNDNDEETVEYESINTGVTLEVTPWVSSSEEITLKLKPTVSNPSTRTSEEGPPNINRRDISTTVRVKSGETIVLGGLIRNEGIKTESRVPILGSIPLLGRLFRDESIDYQETEMVIYITPHVLDEENLDVEGYKQEMLDKVDKEMDSVE
ncbi:secretin and TonB N-terminal domain-containing protein [Orenia marismortui]|uniref:Type IV pilus assembly protein PilQ n=1 Tax=Orenia marismortui TaxID=46469 RepID=A0A4R8H1F8_9FIRM|nr:secretin and TonB N-terminal domain-containing protein [Orenia marismortui]TDX53274.1 type IV pilus assembly protein PilQ [Orenia marismortui]